MGPRERAEGKRGWLGLQAIRPRNALLPLYQRGHGGVHQ